MDGAALGARELRVQKARSGPAVRSRRGPCPAGAGPGVAQVPASIPLQPLRGSVSHSLKTAGQPQAPNRREIQSKFSSVSRSRSRSRSPPPCPRGIPAQAAIQESPPRHPRLQEGKEQWPLKQTRCRHGTEQKTWGKGPHTQFPEEPVLGTSHWLWKSFLQFSEVNDCRFHYGLGCWRRSCVAVE